MEEGRRNLRQDPPYSSYRALNESKRRRYPLGKKDRGVLLLPYFSTLSALKKKGNGKPLESNYIYPLPERGYKEGGRQFMPRLTLTPLIDGFTSFFVGGKKGERSMERKRFRSFLLFNKRGNKRMRREGGEKAKKGKKRKEERKQTIHHA